MEEADARDFFRESGWLTGWQVASDGAREGKRAMFVPSFDWLAAWLAGGEGAAARKQKAGDTELSFLMRGLTYDRISTLEKPWALKQSLHLHFYHTRLSGLLVALSRTRVRSMLGQPEGGSEQWRCCCLCREDGAAE